MNPWSWAQTPPSPHGDGRLRIFNYHLQEFAEIEFKKDGEYLKAGLEAANRVLRSRDDSSTLVIHPNLLDLIDHLQDHFGADTIEIISGYRRKEFNEALLRSGHAVSPVSFHTQGKALDIHIDEIREETLRDYCLKLGLGGVGYYGPLDFVHVDTGPVRRWGEGGPFQRKLVGVLESQSAVQLTSDKNDYLPGESPTFQWSFPPDFTLEKIQNLRLERFWRGQWVTCRSGVKNERDFSLNLASIQCPAITPFQRFGKYRWLFEIQGSSDKQFSSNEFYLKRE